MTLDRDLPLLETLLQGGRPYGCSSSIQLPRTSVMWIPTSQEVRPFLNKLKVFAKEMDITVMMIMHLSKNPTFRHSPCWWCRNVDRGAAGCVVLRLEARIKKKVCGL